MKNFRKTFFLVLIVVFFLICLIYDNSKNSSSDEFAQDVYISLNEITNEEKNEIIIHITGEVKNTGIIKIKEGARLADAIEAAGGVTENADINKINLAYVVQDGQKINIPNVNSVDNINYINEEIGENIIIESLNIKSKLININTATRSRT